jgi:hypothetical protein
MRKLNNLFDWSKFHLWNIIDSEYNMLLEFESFNITAREGNLTNTLLLTILIKLSKSKYTLHKLIDFIGGSLRGNLIWRNKIFTILVLQSLILTQTNAFGKVDISIKIHKLGSDVNLLIDVKIVW